MNRKIKLRVWDKIKKRFVDNDYTFVMFLSGKFDVEEENGEVGKLFERDSDDFVVMQFTGLTDKEGTEIYEGDIFECIYYYDGHRGHRYVVEYSEESACFWLKRIGNKCPQDGVRQTMGDASRHKIIGNIYENPSLLF